MGSWSVYCGTSNISIVSGQECALLPLKKAKGYDSYLPYLPATLPIFGEYDDYGGLENIKEDENTKLIEEYFGIDILTFTKIFTDWFAYDRKEMKKEIKKMKNFEEMKDWTFMFIDKKVYDFMSSNPDEPGHLEFGNKAILNLLGFEYIGENTNNQTSDPTRYKYEWKFQGKLFHSDGTWLMHGKESIYNLTKSYSKLSDIVDIPEDKLWLNNKSMVQLWSYLDVKKQKDKLGWIIDCKHSDSDDFLRKYLEELEEEYSIKNTFKDKAPKNFAELYIKNIAKFGDGLAELVTYRSNLHCMSGSFTPFVKYLTPQCGEFREHQKLLNKFAEINKSYLEDRYDDYDEEDGDFEI